MQKISFFLNCIHCAYTALQTTPIFKGSPNAEIDQNVRIECKAPRQGADHLPRYRVGWLRLARYARWLQELRCGRKSERRIPQDHTRQRDSDDTNCCPKEGTKGARDVGFRQRSDHRKSKEENTWCDASRSFRALSFRPKHQTEHEEVLHKHNSPMFGRLARQTRDDNYPRDGRRTPSRSA